MTIQAYIQEKIQEAAWSSKELHDEFYDLDKIAQELITGSICPYLKKISAELKEYDCHDQEHSEQVLENIEAILQERGIRSLTFAEAVILRLCCYFHDTGMILPDIYDPLLLKVEEDHDVDPKTLLRQTMDDPVQGEHIAFAKVKKHFYCPDNEQAYREFLRKELEDYRKYRRSLEQTDATPEQRILTRHIYLRQTHGVRAKTYAKNLARYFDNDERSFAEALADVVGTISASHCEEAEALQTYETGKEFSGQSGELRCDTAFLAMLLRLGDILHFDGKRASKIIFDGWQPMPLGSPLHWTAKPKSLKYFINPEKSQHHGRDNASLRIVYEGSFKGAESADSYYHLMNHLDKVDKELAWYRKLLQKREHHGSCERMHLGLPEKVERKVSTIGFEAERDLRFKLDQQNAVQLLMGSNLYPKKAMSLRELYQNALDACRCMQAEYRCRNIVKETEIEFGRDHDERGEYLYCRDQGIGMTMDIIKQHLLYVGKSYYKSPAFRRANVQWDNSVAPVAAFGIGLLSCYMISDSIEIITRHYTCHNEEPICVCMKGLDAYGYKRDAKGEEKDILGEHGTIVKLYLREDVKKELLDYLPETIGDAIFELDNYNEFEHPSVNADVRDSMDRFSHSLYHQIQQFVYIPEERIPVFVQSKEHSGIRREKLPRADSAYSILNKYKMLQDCGFDMRRLTGLPNKDIRGEDPRLKVCAQTASVYLCTAADPDSRSTVCTRLHLPNTTPTKGDEELYQIADIPLCKGEGIVCIDGIPVPHSDKYMNEAIHARGIQYHLRGSLRPKLTTNRAAIPDEVIPPEVVRKLDAMRKELINEIVEKIRMHYLQSYRAALTEAGQQYLVNYLLGKYPDQISVELIRLLSEDVLKTYPCCGYDLYDWFRSEELRIHGDTLLRHNKLERRLLLKYLSGAALLLPEDGGRIHLKKGSVEEPNISRNNLPRYVFRADHWPEDYAQYDVVSAYPGIVSEGTYAHMIGNKKGRCKDAQNTFPCIGSIQEICTQALSKDTLGYTGYQIGLSRPHGRSQGRRYVLCLFIEPGFQPKVPSGSPKPSVPEEGLSVLLFDDGFKTAFVTAPGKRSRAELAALIPEEVRARNKNRSYYFTDDTTVF